MDLRQLRSPAGPDRTAGRGHRERDGTSVARPGRYGEPKARSPTVIASGHRVGVGGAAVVTTAAWRAVAFSSPPSSEGASSATGCGGSGCRPAVRHTRKVLPGRAAGGRRESDDLESLCVPRNWSPSPSMVRRSKPRPAGRPPRAPSADRVAGGWSGHGAVGCVEAGRWSRRSARSRRGVRPADRRRRPPARCSRAVARLPPPGGARHPAGWTSGSFGLRLGRIERAGVDDGPRRGTPARRPARHREPEANSSAKARRRQQTAVDGTTSSGDRRGCHIPLRPERSP